MEEIKIEKSEIKTEAGKVAQARRLVEKRLQKVDDLNEQLREIELYQWLLEAQDELRQARADCIEAENEFRDLITENFVKTGERNHPGAKVKLYVIRQYDPDQAVKYCIEHKATAALKLDKKQFEKLADVMKPEFVETYEDPKAFIDGDLSEFLEG